MRAKVTAVFLGIKENSFIDKDTKEKVCYYRASFAVRGEAETFVLGVPKDFDVSELKEFQDAYLLVDFRFDTGFDKCEVKKPKIFIVCAFSLSTSP